jgi:hypothetical protein
MSGDTDVGDADSADGSALLDVADVPGADVVKLTPAVTCNDLHSRLDVSWSGVVGRNPQGDNGRCEPLPLHERECHNAGNCAFSPPVPGTFNWSCTCGQGTQGPWRWYCRIDRVCSIPDAGTND